MDWAQIKRLVVIGICVGAPVLGWAQSPSVPADGDPALQPDLVSALIVRAGDTGGPAWWRVSDDDSSVLIMGIPDWTPTGTTFDQRKLERRIQQAGALLVEQPHAPAIDRSYYPSSTPGGPLMADPIQSYDAIGGCSLPQNPPRCEFFYENQPKGEGFPNLPSVQSFTTTPGVLLLRDVLTAADHERLTRIQDQYKARFGKGAIPAGPPYDALATLQDIEGYVFNGPGYHASIRRDGPRQVEQNAAVIAAMEIAKKQSLPVSALRFGAKEAGTLKGVYLVRQPIAAQQVCIRQMLQALDLPDEDRRIAVRAWAEGDAPSAFKRMHSLYLCPLPQIDDYMWARLVSDRYNAIKQLLAKPGKSVALIWMDPLLVENGVLERFSRNGFKVETPDQVG